MADKLNPKQRQFVAEYLKDRNATQAAIRAGYSENTAASQAHDLLRKPEIATAVAERSEKALAVADADVVRIVTELAALGFSDIRGIMTEDGSKFRPISEWPDDIARCVASIETKRVVIGVKKVKDPDEGEDVLTEEIEIVTKVKLWPKVQALALLAQYRKMVGWGNVDPSAAPPAPFTGLTLIVAPGAAVQVNVGNGKSKP